MVASLHFDREPTASKQEKFRCFKEHQHSTPSKPDEAVVDFELKEDVTSIKLQTSVTEHTSRKGAVYVFNMVAGELPINLASTVESTRKKGGRCNFE